MVSSQKGHIDRYINIGLKPRFCGILEINRCYQLSWTSPPHQMHLTWLTQFYPVNILLAKESHSIPSLLLFQRVFCGPLKALLEESELSQTESYMTQGTVLRRGNCISRMQPCHSQIQRTYLSSVTFILQETFIPSGGKLKIICYISLCNAYSWGTVRLWCSSKASAWEAEGPKFSPSISS